MSNISKIQKALERKSLPEKEYEVIFEESDTFTILVKARDEDEAREKAWDEQNTGNYGSGCGSVDIIDIMEA